MFYTREANQIIKKLQNCEGVTLHFFLIPLISFLAQNSDTFRASKVHWCENYWLRQQLCLTPRVSTTWCIYRSREHATSLREIMSANVLETKDIISCEARITVLNTHDPPDRI